MTGHPSFYMPDATAAFLVYLRADRPELPHLRLYFRTRPPWWAGPAGTT